MANNLVSKEIDLFYTGAAEDKRLTYGLGPLEFERNKELIERFLPKSRSVVLDIGGGPGIYSEWLAGLGHDVYLVEPVAKHIQQAQKRAAKLKKPFKTILGEARKLDFADGFADVVISHGPLYHLQLKNDRIKSLQEARRVLKPDGILLGFAINHTVSTLTGLLNGMIHDEQFMKMCLDELKSGNHNPPASWPGILPEAFFHKPEQLTAEVQEAGFTNTRLFAVEGMVWLDGKYFESRSDASKKAAIMNLLHTTEESTELLSLSPHLMVSAQKA